MSDDIVILDSGDEEEAKPQTVEEVVLSDSDSDEIQIEEEKIISEVQFVGRGYRSFLPRRRKNRKRGNKSSIEDISNEQLISSDSNQSQPNGDIISNDLKTEKITPTKSPSNQVFKTSPCFESPPLNSTQSSGEPLLQTSNENSSQELNSTQSYELNNSSVIDSAIPLPENSDPLDLTLNPNINSSEEPIDSNETNDFGVEDKEVMDNEVNGIQLDESITESITESIQSDLLRTPLERTSTPIAFKPVLERESQNDINPSLPTTPVKKFNEMSDEDILNSPDQSMHSIADTISPRMMSDNESVYESAESNLLNIKSTKDIAIGTENLIPRLNLNENEVNGDQPVGEYYTCSYAGCEEEFNNAVLHYKHEKKHSNELFKRKIPIIKCRHVGCKFMALTQVELMYHNSAHKGIFLCQKSECFFRGITEEDVIQHMRSHRNGKKRALRKKGVYCECGELSCQKPRGKNVIY